MAQVHTVLGPIAPEAMGITAMHEHILFGLLGWERDAAVAIDRPKVFEKIKQDLLDFKAAGGGTLVDCSGIALGRDVEFYQSLSQATGVHIIACTGFWEEGSIANHFLAVLFSIPGFFPARDADFFRRTFLGELTHGMMIRWQGRSQVKAGIVEAGNSQDKITPLEEEIYRGAARAAKQSGCAVTTNGVQMARRQLELLKEEGLDPARIIIGHCDAVPDLDRDKEICRQGANVAYDNVGDESLISDDKRVELVKAMIQAGCTQQVFLSTGTIGYGLGWPQPARTYSHLLRSFLPKLRQAGVKEQDIQTIMVENPKRLLPF